jgi:hypothetical protein
MSNFLGAVALGPGAAQPSPAAASALRDPAQLIARWSLADVVNEELYAGQVSAVAPRPLLQRWRKGVAL